MTVEPGSADAAPLRRCGSDQLLFVLHGEASLETETEPPVALATHSLAHVPAGRAHRLGAGTERATLLDLVLPPIRPGEPVDTIAEEPDEDAGTATPILVRRLEEAGFADGSRPNGFAVQTLIGPADGMDRCTLNAARVAPRGAGPRTHIHTFDQLFVVLSGHLRVEVAGQTIDAEPDQVVLLPTGVPHTQWNEHADPEIHLAVLLPGPAPGEPVTIPVDFATTAPPNGSA